MRHEPDRPRQHRHDLRSMRANKMGNNCQYLFLQWAMPLLLWRTCSHVPYTPANNELTMVLTALNSSSSPTQAASAAGLAAPSHNNMQTHTRNCVSPSHNHPGHSTPTYSNYASSPEHSWKATYVACMLQQQHVEAPAVVAAATQPTVPGAPATKAAAAATLAPYWVQGCALRAVVQSQAVCFLLLVRPLLHPAVQRCV